MKPKTNPINPVQWQWIWDVAANVAGVGTADLVMQTRRSQAVEARRGLYLFLHECGFSSVQIGRFCDRDHSTILHAVRTAMLDDGGTAFEVRQALRRENMKRDPVPVAATAPEPEPLPPPAAKSEPADTLYRVRFTNNPQPHYLIEPARNGRRMPTRRNPRTATLTAVFGRIKERFDEKFFRAEHIPGIGEALVPVDRETWRIAAAIPASEYQRSLTQ